MQMDKRKFWRKSRLHSRFPNHSLDRDPGAYLVVTLLVGTIDDRPLFDRVQSASDLNAALQRLGAISPEELLVYELL